jgi:hypothetical protein
MKRIIIAAALAVAATGVHAQGFNPYLNGNGTPPFIYGSSPQMPPVTNFDWNFSTPAVPRIESYIPALTRGPTNYPCTMPGCR